MWIRLRIDNCEPPRGVLLDDRAVTVGFDGWLELLCVLSDALTTAAASMTGSEAGGGDE